MFILVSRSFGFVTGELEGVSWWMFNLCTSFLPNLKTLVCSPDQKISNW